MSIQVVDLQYQFGVRRNKPRKASAKEVRSAYANSPVSVQGIMQEAVLDGLSFFQALRHLVERDIGVTQYMQPSKAAYRAWGHDVYDSTYRAP